MPSWRETGLPSKTAVPLLGAIKPAMIQARVDFTGTVAAQNQQPVAVADCEIDVRQCAPRPRSPVVCTCG